MKDNAGGMMSKVHKEIEQLEELRMEYRKIGAGDFWNYLSNRLFDKLKETDNSLTKDMLLTFRKFVLEAYMDFKREKDEED